MHHHATRSAEHGFEGTAIPQLRREVDVLSLPLTPADGYVLSRIDGATTAADIVATSALGPEPTVAALEKLTRLGAVAWANAGAPPARSGERDLTPPPRSLTAPVAPAHGDRRRSPPTDVETHAQLPAFQARVSARPTAPPRRSITPQVPVVDLDLGERQRIDQKFAEIGRVDHYATLELPPQSTRQQVRDAYFNLSKQFHPDTKYGRALGDYKLKMEAIFKALTEAYDVVGHPKRRAAYDQAHGRPPVG